MDGSIKRTTLLIVHFLCLLDNVFAQNQCYVCNYEVLSSDHTTTGPEACYEPFFNPVADGIKRVNCTGDCHYIEWKTSDMFRAFRGCSSSDTCVEAATMTQDGGSSTRYCCSGSLCNGETITNKTAEPLGDDECHKCIYITRASGTAGSPGCYEPFDASAVGVVKTQCNTTCQLTVIQRWDELIVSRDCYNSVFDCETCETSRGNLGSGCSYCCSPGTVCNESAPNTLTTTDEPAELLGDDECYSCFYNNGVSGTVGSPGCYEPFDASAVGVVKTQCDTACQMTVVKSGEDLTVTRDCHDSVFECETSCVTFGGDSVCTYCCSPGTVCNKSPVNLLSLSLFLATILCVLNA